MKKFTAASVPIMLAAGGALAEAGPDWREGLEWQMLKEHDCEVNYLTNIEVRAVDDAEVVFARVHCMDERAFDASRPREGTRFEVTECTLAVC